MRYLFFALDGVDVPALPAAEKPAYTAALWRPTWRRVAPRGAFKFSFLVWWVFHHLHIFKNRNYGIFLFYDGRHAVHYSCLFPGYFRFPFMGRRNLQIGDVFTSEAYRGRSLATSALREIVRTHGAAADRFWYITDESNAPSIRAALKAGFRKVGEGGRTRMLGLRLLGAYKIEKMTAA